MLIRYTKLVPANSILSYAITAVMVGAVILARLALTPVLGDDLLDVSLFPAVLMAAVIGGAGAGAFAILISAVAALFIFPSRENAPFTAGSITEFGLYLFGAGLSVVVAATLRAAVARLELAQGKLVTVLDASGTGTWWWNMREDCVEWDTALNHLFRIDPANSPCVREDFLRFVHPDDRELVIQRSRETLATGGADYEFRAIRADGTIRWMYSRNRMLPDNPGQESVMVGACLDVTERKEAEERQQLFVHELNHRVKNTLSVVQSLALLTLNGSKSLAAFKEAFQARLFALSATHNILTEELWHGAPMREILSAELAPYGGLDEGRVSASGEPVRLTPQQAVSFGMVFHELATNAAKYGALSAPNGRVDIAWRKTASEAGKPRLEIMWVESNGPVVQETICKGFGSRLIERNIDYDLEGTVEMRFLPEGLQCSINVPL
ncbi:sensor histidine kinase [Microvirga sp. 2MCAF38]|uniref:sensor histidine kinase n=1 Tax=Microvirga sp. 2MCAF38 TaxID=3232989 RepID=UPI003F9522CC